MEPYEYIKKAIIIGELKPGTRLTEESLAGELNVSRTPIREAIKQLESEGLITSLKRGVMVRKFTKQDIRQIYDLRALLESYAAGQAALYRDDEDIRQMVEANNEYMKVIEATIRNKGNAEIYDIMEVNQKFHKVVWTASKNEYLSFHISKVVVVPLVFQSFYWYDADDLRRSLKGHQTILKAIENQDSNRVQVAVQEHVLQGRDQVLKHLELSNDVLEYDDEPNS